jgi:hypothetical protein
LSNFTQAVSGSGGIPGPEPAVTVNVITVCGGHVAGVNVPDTEFPTSKVSEKVPLLFSVMTTFVLVWPSTVSDAIDQVSKIEGGIEGDSDPLHEVCNMIRAASTDKRIIFFIFILHFTDAPK